MDKLSNDIPSPVIGHRGIPSLAPENSLEGLHKASELGVGWVEMDVTLNPDGIAVMSHDPVTGGLGSSPALPTLAETLQRLNELSTGLNLEIKDHGYPPELIVAQVLKVIEQSQVPGDHLLLSSFNSQILAQCLIQAPHLRRGLIAKTLSKDWQEISVQLNLYSLHPYWKTLTPNLVTEIKRQGLHLYTWTVNDPKAVRILWSSGLDGVITDYPQRFK
ncbi:MAG: hypothetical protein CMI01_17525 [Oceanospirillaceae bacterium]|jgi:glycerophosphoryl diester phosphodiesterase|uniref:glycerophosphodiester phosphodiesterase family protein n=1 Tax=Marinobacterium litorale TaxID=404770 RepID=UPI000483E16B|nr:glycerophosphodiester phosphodiesterase family protein [Marinobacterium litorale]MBT00447.1 hypothetical protein [Oceanospirillaceae bacterium]